MSEIVQEEYDQIKNFLYEIAGINLGSEKKTLVQSRLFGRMTQLKLKNFSEYLKFVKKSEEERVIFVNSMTTNKTDWFRENDHFEYLKSHVEKNLRNIKHPLSIWSAASSTGEEIYSLAMLLKEIQIVHPTFNFRILGTDIDTEVLKHAESAFYNMSTVEAQVPKYLRLKYFEKQSEDGRKIQVKNTLTAHAKFRQFNLISSELNVPIKFDYIFLRNVLIYFDNKTIQIVINRLLKHLQPNGLLFIGHAESLNGIKHNMKLISDSVYQKVG